MVPAGTKTSGLPQKLLSISPKYRKKTSTAAFSLSGLEQTSNFACGFN